MKLGFGGYALGEVLGIVPTNKYLFISLYVTRSASSKDRTLLTKPLDEDMRYGFICFLLVCYIIQAPGTTAMRRHKRLAAGDLITTDIRYPWVVSILRIYVKNSNQDLMLSAWCTGSIIDIYGNVLTAAHCLDETKEFSSEKFTLKKVAVKWGSYLSINNTVGVLVNLSMIVRHPSSYSVHQKPDVEDIDVGLILLDEFIHHPIDCSDPTLIPIPLSIRGANSTPPQGMFAGFGAYPMTNESNIFTDYTDGRLNEIRFRYFGRGELRKNNKTIYYNASVPSSSMFWAFPYPINESYPYNPITKRNYSGLCVGDSGGPYMVDEDDDVVFLRGIAGSREKHINDFGPCSQFLDENYFMDINYPKTRNWIRGRLVARYNETGVGIGGDIPRVCRYHD